MEDAIMQAEKPQKEKKRWPMLNCPICNHHMFIQRQRATINEKTGQQYIKTTYVCSPDDTWVTTEIPRKLAATIIDEKHLPPLESDHQFPLIQS